MGSQSYSFRVYSCQGVRLHPLHLVVTGRQAGKWESFTAEEGKAPDLPGALTRTVGRGQLQWADWDWGILCACLGVHISLSLDGPDLETGLKIN